MLNLDTHILIHALAGSVSREERELLESSPWSISAIVLWEIEMLYQHNRIPFGLDYGPIAAMVAHVHTWAISPRICLALRELDFKSDPADLLIAATSLVYKINYAVINEVGIDISNHRSTLSSLFAITREKRVRYSHRTWRGFTGRLKILQRSNARKRSAKPHSERFAIRSASASGRILNC